MKTALMTLIEELEYRKEVSAFARDMLKKAQELLALEKEQIIDFHVDCVRHGTLLEDGEFSELDERLVRESATTIFTETFGQ